MYPNSDPYLVLGAEKHDAGIEYPSFNGYLDDLRISRGIRYSANFTASQEPLLADSSTIALYNFNSGQGSELFDVVGLSNGIIKTGGSPAGPLWSGDNPYK